MTRAQTIALWMIGALALVSYLQSYEVAQALRGGAVLGPAELST